MDLYVGLPPLAGISTDQNGTSGGTAYTHAIDMN